MTTYTVEEKANTLLSFKGFTVALPLLPSPSCPGWKDTTSKLENIPMNSCSCVGLVEKTGEISALNTIAHLNTSSLPAFSE
jgi:hypothetical protein